MAYRTAIAEMAQLGTLDVWYTRIDEQMLLDAIAQMGTDLEKGKGKAERKAVKSAAKTATANFDKARRRTSMKAAQKLTELVDGHYQFLEEPPLLSRAVVTADDRRVVEVGFAGLPGDAAR